jgi:4-amino-4-deoxy-L-arabinose transferase-like glycosyltransferase
MSDTKSSEPVRPFPLGMARRGLTIGGVALVAINLVMMVAGGLGGASGSLLSALLWGGAAVCFLGAFVVFMLEPMNVREAGAGKQGAPAKAPEPASTTAGGALDADKKEPAADAPRGQGDEAPAATPDVVATEASAPPQPATDDEPAKGPTSEPSPLIRRGNPMRWTRGSVTTALGSLFAYLLMAHPGQLRWGVPLGAVFVAVASWGVMDLLGTFDDPDDRVASSHRLGEIAPDLAGFAASFLLFCASLGFAHAGRLLPQWGWGLVVTGTFLLGVVALYRLARQLGAWAPEDGSPEVPIYKRYGFWVVVIGAVLYFPFMGTYALWDPWETHYGEVSREILAKDDWISLWWAQDGWFWSKPVLDMWMQAIAMATLGVHYKPDQMLVGDGMKPIYHPEWAVRAPVVLLTILALYILYKGVAKTFGNRPAFLGAVVLATMPDWFFIGHQTMTDMPFVGAMTACMGLVLVGLRTPENQEARAYEVRVGKVRLRFTAWHLVFGAVLLCVVPQILYLVSRNLEVLWRPGAHGFRPHWDEFWSGSGGGNCGLPGNEECKLTTPASVPHSTGANPDGFFNGLWRTVGGFEPALQGLMWAVVLGIVLYMNWGERRTRRLYYLAAWFFAAISTLGKGPAGFGLPMLVTFAYLCASRPHEGVVDRILRIIRELTQFEILGGLLVVLVVAIPWYVAMYVRHGSPFTDRLIFHDMFNRAFHHVHDTNEGDDTSFRFYVWQLGYALFPWTGLAPIGLLWWLRRGTTAQDNERADTSVLLCMWFVFAFALFSFMGTKFHHYILPAVPAVAMLIGIVLDDMLGARRVSKDWSLVGYVGGMLAGTALMTFGIARTQAGSFLGVKPDGHLTDGSLLIGASLAVMGAATVALSAWLFGKRFEPASPEPEDDDAARSHTSRMLAAGAVAGGLLLVLVARDLVIKPEGADQPGAIRLLQLFTYNYRRAWPDSLDFAAALAGFGAVGALLSIALAIKPIRRHAVVAMSAFAFIWALWGLDVYMQRTAQHWGQHEVMEAYYADRGSSDEVLVAYQMNWKGENFYTGNHIPAFVSTGATFTNWMKKKRDEGAKVIYFVTEHGRIGGLKSEVAAKSYREVTDKALCNKFVLVRAEL